MWGFVVFILFMIFFCKTQSARWVIHGDVLGGGRWDATKQDDECVGGRVECWTDASVFSWVYKG